MNKFFCIFTNFTFYCMNCGHSYIIFVVENYRVKWNQFIILVGVHLVGGVSLQFSQVLKVKEIQLIWSFSRQCENTSKYTYTSSASAGFVLLSALDFSMHSLALNKRSIWCVFKVIQYFSLKDRIWYTYSATRTVHDLPLRSE